VASIFNTAKSCVGFASTTWASKVRPSASVTVIDEAPSITWSFVKMTPFELTMNPLPVSVRVEVPKSGLVDVPVAVMLTTAGSTSRTTRTTGSRTTQRMLSGSELGS
jgi:hypothetical protein